MHSWKEKNTERILLLILFLLIILFFLLLRLLFVPSDAFLFAGMYSTSPVPAAEPAESPALSPEPEISAANAPAAAPESTAETMRPSLNPAPTAVPAESTAQEDPAPAPTEPPAEKTEGERIAEFALQFEGYGYVYGARSPEEGFDCSGLVYYVYRQFGYKLYRVAADQATMGIHVEYDDLQPGDILGFRSAYQNTIGHIGIYVGDGLFLHAMDSAHGVVLWSLDDWLESRTLEARRLVGNLPKYTQDEISRMEAEDEEAIAQTERAKAYEEFIQSQFQQIAEQFAAPAPTPAPDDGNLNGSNSVEEKYRRAAEQEAAERAAREAAEQAAREAAEQAAREAAEQAAREAAEQAAREAAEAQALPGNG